MPGYAYVVVSGNVANVVSLPSGTPISIKAKTGSSLTQKITITNSSGEIFSATGSGEGTTIGQSTITTDSALDVKFEYLKNGQWCNSSLQAGGPYQIGNYNLLPIIAENGDDRDYNDSVVEFSWYTPKG